MSEYREKVAAPRAKRVGPALAAPAMAWSGLALIALATCLAYWPALGGEMLWDDKEHVPRPELQSLDGLRRIWFDVEATQQYYPLLFSSFWFQHRLWGDWMLPYHLVNLFQHLGAACLVYAILRKLQAPGALLAAAFFALHPVQVESVAWVTEQKNTLAAVFYLSAMLAYLHFDTSRARSWYAVALVLFAAAVLSKTTAVTLPPALLLILWWVRGTLSWRRDVLPLIPFFLVSLADGLWTRWVERNVLMAVGPDFELTFLQGVLLSGRALWFYFEKLIWPADLIFVYPRWQIDPAQGWQWLFPLSAAAVLVALWAVRRRWRGPLAGVLFFIGTLFPVLGFLNVYFYRYSYVTDHFQYLASLGIFVLAAAGIALAIARLAPQARIVGRAACVALLGVLGTLTWWQSYLYGGDVLNLYQTTIRQNPACWMAYNNLGNVMLSRERPADAVPLFERSLALKEDHADAHSNFGAALLALGRPNEAIPHLERALALRPNYALAESNLGGALFMQGQFEEAILHFQKTIQLAPNYAPAYNNLAVALMRVDRPEEASEQCRALLRLRPDVDAWANLASANAQLNRPADAIAAAQSALDLARAQGKAAQAQQIEAWLTAYQATPGDGPGTSTAPALPPAQP